MLTVEEATNEQLLFEIAKREFNEKGEFLPAQDVRSESCKNHMIPVYVGGTTIAYVTFAHPVWKKLRQRNSTISGS